MLPAKELSEKIWYCVVQLLYECAADSTLAPAPDFLFTLASQIEFWDCGSQQCYLLNKDPLKNKYNDPELINQKIAVMYVEQHPKDSADRTKARKKVREIFLSSQQTLNEWESDLEKSLPEAEVNLNLLKHAGGFYKMTRAEIKEKALTLKDTSGNDYEIKDPQKLRNHIM